MKSTTESGINTYVNNLVRLIVVCSSFGDLYNPAVQRLTIEALKELLAQVRNVINDVDHAMPPLTVAKGARQEVFARLKPLATRIRAAAITLKLPESVVVHIEEIVRKIRGKRKHTLKSEYNNSNGEPKKHISVAQLSFAEQIEHFSQIVKLVAGQPEYIPEEADLKVDALNVYLDELWTVNKAVIAAERPLVVARNARNILLYAPETGMMDTAIAVKEYVKSIFGAKSHYYKEVSHIKFENKKI
ncbi:MAG: hypothetical protein LBS54_07325 [Dysgonamonadaceae bacterium]|jgi:hypothetical protein|nr:hypothetical protein [Dysgonamonadaceae bacterium]